MKSIPQKYTVGSDWLAGSVYCDFLNLQKWGGEKERERGDAEQGTQGTGLITAALEH